jgi:cytochrome c553
MKPNIWTTVAGSAAITAFMGNAAPAGQAGTPQKPPLVISSMSGRDLYGLYCAACHGRDGKGNGPAAVNLRTAPANLTGIAARHDGTFPRDEIRAVIVGDRSSRIAEHVSDDMPVWEPIFRGLDPNERVNRVRVENILDFIKSIQK